MYWLNLRQEERVGPSAPVVPEDSMQGEAQCRGAEGQRGRGLGEEREAQAASTYLEGLVYGREMANTLAYCSTAKFL